MRLQGGGFGRLVQGVSACTDVGWVGLRAPVPGGSVSVGDVVGKDARHQVAVPYAYRRDLCRTLL